MFEGSWKKLVRGALGSSDPEDSKALQQISVVVKNQTTGNNIKQINVDLLGPVKNKEIVDRVFQDLDLMGIEYIDTDKKINKVFKIKELQPHISPQELLFEISKSKKDRARLFGENYFFFTNQSISSLRLLSTFDMRAQTIDDNDTERILKHWERQIINNVKESYLKYIIEDSRQQQQPKDQNASQKNKKQAENSPSNDVKSFKTLTHAYSYHSLKEDYRRDQLWAENNLRLYQTIIWNMNVPESPSRKSQVTFTPNGLISLIKKNTSEYWHSPMMEYHATVLNIFSLTHPYSKTPMRNGFDMEKYIPSIFMSLSYEEKLQHLEWSKQIMHVWKELEEWKEEDGIVYSRDVISDIVKHIDVDSLNHIILEKYKHASHLADRMKIIKNQKVLSVLDFMLVQHIYHKDLISLEHSLFSHMIYPVFNTNHHKSIGTETTPETYPKSSIYNNVRRMMVTHENIMVKVWRMINLQDSNEYTRKDKASTLYDWDETLTVNHKQQEIMALNSYHSTHLDSNSPFKQLAQFVKDIASSLELQMLKHGLHPIRIKNTSLYTTQGNRLKVNLTMFSPLIWVFGYGFMYYWMGKGDVNSQSIYNDQYNAVNSFSNTNSTFGLPSWLPFYNMQYESNNEADQSQIAMNNNPE